MTEDELVAMVAAVLGEERADQPPDAIFDAALARLDGASKVSAAAEPLKLRSTLSELLEPSVVVVDSALAKKPVPACGRTPLRSAAWA